MYQDKMMRQEATGNSKRPSGGSAKLSKNGFDSVAEGTLNRGEMTI
jgi:hypothetical protein